MARYKIQFWLNSQKPDELTVADTVAELKLQRSFSAVVRDGIMIVNELRQGKIDLLLKLYPWVADKINELAPPPPPPTPPIDMTPIYEEFRRFVAEQGRAIPDSRDNGFPVMSGLMPAPKPSKLQKAIALPVFEDEPDEGATIVLAARKGDMTTTNNFLASFASLGD